ncbi:hypothetical protein [Paenibacillus sp. HB172176]|uniref:hypothetical protein n=1 Tax=Paenibacillus sp. HB172176 TaxID=2493690 RepID=UPI0014393008|nr:hypothetical protein [Paenibacillus sp. HB172176]
MNNNQMTDKNTQLLQVIYGAPLSEEKLQAFSGTVLPMLTALSGLYAINVAGIEPPILPLWKSID